MALSVKVNWSKNGSFSDFGDDVTARVRKNPGVSLEYGRDQSTALAPVVAGRGSFTLDNSSGDYNPLNTSSPIYGRIKPARPVLITRTTRDGVDVIVSEDLIIGDDLYVDEDSTYTLFRGHTDDTPLSPDLTSRNVSVSMVDALADFRGQEINTQIYSGVRTGTAIGYILDALDWPADLRDIDPGVTVMPWWYETGTDALTAVDKIVRSEGPPALFTVGPDGEIVFRDRHHRLLRQDSVTSQDIWYDLDPKPVMLKPFTYDAGWRNIVNNAGEEIDVLATSQRQIMWRTSAPITLSDGEVKIIVATLQTPVTSVDVPDAIFDPDYTVLSGAVTVELIMTSGTAIPIKLTATGPTVLSGMRLWGTPLNTAQTVQIMATDSTSIADYGKRDMPSDLPWCNPYDAAAVLNIAVSLWAQPAAQIEASFLAPASDPVTTDAVLARNLSDRVTVNVDALDMSQDFYIENIKHEVKTETDHVVTFGCEAVPATQTSSLQFDVAGVGFDNGRFGTGLDSPATMFIFDSNTAGQRFNEGLFCT